MSVIPYVKTKKGTITFIKWADLENGDTGQPIHMPHSPDKTFQVYGVFGSGGSISLYGSNDLPTDASPIYFITHLTDLDHMTYAAADGNAVIDNPNMLRPGVTAGDGNTKLTAILCFRRV